MSAKPTLFLQQDIFFVKVGAQRNWKQFFLSVTYFVFTGGEVWHLFILTPQLYFHELPTQYPQEKILDPQNTHQKKFWTHEIAMRKNLGSNKYPREEIWDLTKHPPEKILDSEIPTKINFGLTEARWHETHWIQHIFLIRHVLKRFDWIFATVNNLNYNLIASVKNVYLTSSINPTE